MNLICIRCDAAFENSITRGYCDACLQHFADVRDGIHASQRPAPGVCADGKFADEKECPQSVFDPVSNKNVCGLCGSDEIEMGYGLGTGFGMGSYNFCHACNHFLDFSEDTGEW